MAADEVTHERVEFYRRYGAVKVPGVISRDEAAEFRAVAMELLLAGPTSECKCGSRTRRSGG
jgi:hypothetical protein